MLYIIITLSTVTVIETGIIVLLFSVLKKMLIKIELLSSFLEFLYSPDAEKFYEQMGYVKKK